MKFIFAAIFLFVLSGAAFCQDDILSKAKFGMSGDELMTAFKDKGISSYTYSDNDDNNNSDDDNDNDDNNNRSGYRISNYSIDGSSYSVRFSMNRGKLKEIRFSLNKNDKAMDIYEGWKKTFNAKYGSPVHDHDFSGYGRTENERAWEGSGTHVELHYFEGNGRKAMDLTYSRD
jgi:hypothetical protein